jgi:hypothetical protein
MTIVPNITMLFADSFSLAAELWKVVFFSRENREFMKTKQFFLLFGSLYSAKNDLHLQLKVHLFRNSNFVGLKAFNYFFSYGQFVVSFHIK